MNVAILTVAVTALLCLSARATATRLSFGSRDHSAPPPPPGEPGRGGCPTAADPGERCWHVVAARTLREAEGLLDHLEHSGYGERQLVIGGDELFGVRWR
jgi:hypothetical protein